ncbi:MAG: potassium channel family protein [Pirellulales bacterium]
MFAAAATVVGCLLILVTFADAFEATVLPRRVTRRWRPTRLFYRTTWGAWQGLANRFPPGRYRENALAVYGPLSLLVLFSVWVALLITGFAAIHWSRRTLPNDPPWFDCLYLSGETFFTLGYGDLTPQTPVGKLLSVFEAGVGFGFMAIIIGYLPVLYQAFSRREQTIALLDARAGSPPTAGELLRRFGGEGGDAELERFLVEWEIWSADLLESHLSFPVLGFYRSQHDNQSWLAALTTMLDVAAIILALGNEACRRRAQLTFAMARHAAVDLSLVFWLPPTTEVREELSPAELEQIARSLGVPERAAELEQRLRELRALYEPFVLALSVYFRLRLPPIVPPRTAADNWQSSPWMKRAPGITELAAAERPEEHFG